MGENRKTTTSCEKKWRKIYGTRTFSSFSLCEARAHVIKRHTKKTINYRMYGSRKHGPRNSTPEPELASVEAFFHGLSLVRHHFQNSASIADSSVRVRMKG